MDCNEFVDVCKKNLASLKELSINNCKSPEDMNELIFRTCLDFTSNYLTEMLKQIESAEQQSL